MQALIFYSGNKIFDPAFLPNCRCWKNKC